MLSSAHVERRLAAILAADVAGSCRLIGIDEEGTLARLKALRRTLFDPKIAQHHGRVVKNTGDGAIAEFASVVDAVRCADEVQRGMAEQNIDVPQDKRIELRIGIHVGDIIIEENDIFGDGVNIAVRLEGIAEPGGIRISDDARRQIRGKVDVTFEDLGSQSLKNIAEPMRVWRVPYGRAVPAVPNRWPVDGAALTLPDKPSIAVLPFHNLSGYPEQEYFADGMVDDIITALSHFKALFVIARNSSFTYKGRAVDVKQVGRELGVRYVLEGSVRKAANRVRITGQLVDAATGAHLWADRFDGDLGDVFDLQDQVTESVVGAIAPAVEKAEIERAKRKPTESLDAYALYLRGLARLYQFAGRQANDEALRFFNSAIELDPDFASAYGRAALCYVIAKINGWFSDTANEIAEVTRLAQRAVELGKDDAIALAASGWALAFVVRDLEVGAGLIERALVLNSNSAEAWHSGGWAKIWLGEPESAIGRFARAMRLSPLDPRMSGMRAGTAFVHFLLGRYDEAASWAAMALQDNPDLQAGLRIAA
ncbi:MAG: adenylate/guanylate cyclase domain-containing protein, partial [Pseudolabrys sp.]|nr:adenylate/guanylate cyclase domain-containing protein [Pseudolabrys sp.]